MPDAPLPGDYEARDDAWSRGARYGKPQSISDISSHRAAIGESIRETNGIQPFAFFTARALARSLDANRESSGSVSVSFLLSESSFASGAASSA